MKVFLVATSLETSYGGPAYSVSRLATALADAGVTVGLWAPDGSALTTSLLPHDTSVRRLGGSASEALAELGYADIVHDNGIWNPHNHRVARISADRRIPRVVSTRGMLEPWALCHKSLKKKIAWSVYQKRDLNRAAWLHATSEAEAANVARLKLDPPVRMIPNGIDVPTSIEGKRDRSLTEPRTALFLGRIYPIKGLPMLIDAWRAVLPEGWRLKIAGPDEAGHLAEVKSAVAGAGVEGVVSFTGPVDGSAKEALLSNADLFVLPSQSESFGMAVAEALAFGLPVLTTTAVPWPILEDEGCGWRVGPDSESIAAGLRLATSLDAATLAAMGVRGRAIVSERFQWANIAAAFVSEYAKALPDQLSRGR